MDKRTTQHFERTVMNDYVGKINFPRNNSRKRLNKKKQDLYDL